MAVEQELIERVEKKWENVYWFSRMLINSDKHGGIGKENKLISKIASSVRLVEEENEELSENEILGLQKQAVKNMIDDRVKNARTSQQCRFLNFEQIYD